MPSWYPSEYYIQPHYSTIPGVVVADCVAPSFRLRKLRFWRRARTAALEEWEAGGITFGVVETVVPYLCDQITLTLGDVPDPIPGWAAFEEPPCEQGCEGCAWSEFDLEFVRDLMAARNLNRLRYLIGHEIGHNLGFGHGGSGIMGAGWGSHVNAEELAALEEYWGTDGG